jgi:hypothetical protein
MSRFLLDDPKWRKPTEIAVSIFMVALGAIGLTCLLYGLFKQAR